MDRKRCEKRHEATQQQQPYSVGINLLLTFTMKQKPSAWGTKRTLELHTFTRQIFCSYMRNILSYSPGANVYFKFQIFMAFSMRMETLLIKPNAVYKCKNVFLWLFYVRNEKPLLIEGLVTFIQLLL